MTNQTFDSVCEEFLLHKKTDKKSDNTIKNYRLDLMFFKHYVVVYDMDVFSLTLRDLDKFKSYIVLEYTMPNGKNLSAASINRCLTTMKQLFNHLQYSGYRSDNPATLIKMVKTPEREPEYYEVEQVRQILKSFQGENKERDRAIFFIFLFSGLRVSELSNLKLEDIRGDKIRILHGKGDKERVCSLTPQTLRVVQEYLNVRKSSECQSLFLTDRHSGISVRAIQAMVERRLIQSGVHPVYSVHKLRHTAATINLSGGSNLVEIQEMLGHADIRTTSIYAHVPDEQKKKTAKKIQDYVNVED